MHNLLDPAETKPRRFAACLFALAFATYGPCCTSARADDTAFFGNGSSIFPIREDRVRMVKEVVTLRPLKPYPRSNTELPRRWQVDCTFWFENTTGGPLTVEMGFPDWTQSGAVPEPDLPFRKSEWIIKQFRTSVRGQQTAISHKILNFDDKVDPSGRTAPAPKSGRDSSEIADYVDFHGAYTWPVAFRPHERLVVRNSYEIGTAGMSVSPEGDLEGVRGNAEAKRYAAELQKSMDQSGEGVAVSQSVTYVAQTGRAWQGSIGEADITIELPPSFRGESLMPTPPATSVSERELRWHFVDWEPDVDIKLLAPEYEFAPTGSVEPDPSSPPRGCRLPTLTRLSEIAAWIELTTVNHFSGELLNAALLRSEACLSQYAKRKAGHEAVVELKAGIAALRDRLANVNKR